MAKRRKQEKAAFQMSLGFIIAVVFAIVLLALALTWLRGMITGIEQLTKDLEQDAKTTLRNALTSTASDFGIYPNQYDLPTGYSLRMSAGIENDAGDGKDHKFVINVIPASAGDGVLNSKGCSDFGSCTSLKEEMKKWATFDDIATLIKINGIAFKFIEIRPQDNVVKGTYLFNVVSCYDKVIGADPVSANCKEDSSNLWGSSAQQLLLIIV
jgi:hypothetical protein